MPFSSAPGNGGGGAGPAGPTGPVGPAGPSSRTNLKNAPYNAPLDGASHLMTQAAALAAYPQCGATGSIEQDTAAWLQAEYDLRTGSGGIIGLPDGARMRVSQTLWLQLGNKVHFHGGRGTELLGEQCGTNPVLRASVTGGGPTGAARAVPFKDLVLYAWNSGRAYFNAVLTNGVCAPAPGYANAAAMSGHDGGYRTGSCAIRIDDGVNGNQGTASVYSNIEGLRWFNFDEGTRFGDDTFGILFLNCMAENNNKGVAWTQTTGLNSMEGMRFQGGSYSNNNYAFHWVSTFINGNSQNSPQGGGMFISDLHIDYNLVSQGVFLMSPDNYGYPGSGVHFTNCYIENNTDNCIGTAVWFQVRGRASWTENEFYINNGSGVQPSGLVSIGDNSSGSMVNNRIGGGCPLFISSTTNYKSVFAFGNECNPVGAAVIALRDGNGTVCQRLSASVPPSFKKEYSALVLDASQHDCYDALILGYNCTSLVLPSNGNTSFVPGKVLTIYNYNSTPATIMIPPGVQCGGLGGYSDGSQTSNATYQNPIPGNSMITLRRNSTQGWGFFGAFASSYGS